MSLYANACNIKADQQEQTSRNLSNASPIYTLEKKKNWAVTGGIASGIAGPAAGLGMAMHTMRENDKIEQRNAERMSTNAQFSAQCDEVAEKGFKIAAEYRKTARDYNNKIETAKTKIVIDNIPADVLYENLTITEKVEYISCSGNYLRAKLKISNKYKPEIDGAGKMTTDGYFSIRFLCDSNLEIGRIDNYALPDYGLKCGETTEVTVLLDKYVKGIHDKYRIEITPKELWLMEV